MEAFESALLPVLPLKDAVQFPFTITPLFVVRPSSLAAMEAALKADKRLFVVAQRTGDMDEPGRADLFPVGTVAEILQVLRVPDGSAKVLVEGLYAARLVEFIDAGAHKQALLVRTEFQGESDLEAEAWRRSTLNLLDRYSRLTDKLPDDVMGQVRLVDSPLDLAHVVANFAQIPSNEKQSILEASHLEDKYLTLNSALEREIQLLEVESQIAAQVKSQLGRSQRELFLQEQLKAIERELGTQDPEGNELTELAASIAGADMPSDVRLRADRELARLARMPQMSPEATVVRSYIEWLAEVPWTKRTEDRIDLNAARTLLDHEHYGLEKVKERIVEYLAVAKLAGEARGPILCLVGPPGVGKTSLARSIARCIGREFVRIALGGVRDEAEIRGHRRTYIGALPGKLIQGMKKAGTVNPLVLLDEIDKLSSDFRGDPSSALLEVLDPEQNGAFNDHYLEVDYDLSRVLFIATANNMSAVPAPLVDRMEVIRLTGYTDLEKLEIAKRHLLPKALSATGLKPSMVSLTRPALSLIVQGYTREAGVRSLERELEAVCRKVATRVVLAQEAGEKAPKVKITPEEVRAFLGPERHRDTTRGALSAVGNAIGLAWTEVGGEVLHVEVRTMPGRGELILTGKLGEVMKESARTALSTIRSLSAWLKIDPEVMGKVDIHVHLPEGAIPKDGPSAGITLATSLASALSGLPARQDLAMTGEITLHGKVLKIGGLKEKVLAAHRHRIPTVLIPAENMAEVIEIPEEVRRKVTITPVSTLEEVLEVALHLPRLIIPRAPSRRAPGGSRGSAPIAAGVEGPERT
jgi:ATP-dependent Lon protease